MISGTGDVSGNTPSLKVTLLSDTDAIANFIKTYLLTITVSPAGSGTVTPGGGTYDTGTELEISAIAADGYVFTGWDGLSDNATSQNVTMSRDFNIIAHFELVP